MEKGDYIADFRNSCGKTGRNHKQQEMKHANFEKRNENINFRQGTQSYFPKRYDYRPQQSHNQFKPVRPRFNSGRHGRYVQKNDFQPSQCQNVHQFQMSQSQFFEPSPSSSSSSSMTMNNKSISSNQQQCNFQNTFNNQPNQYSLDQFSASANVQFVPNQQHSNTFNSFPGASQHLPPGFNFQSQVTSSFNLNSNFTSNHNNFNMNSQNNVNLQFSHPSGPISDTIPLPFSTTVNETGLQQSQGILNKKDSHIKSVRKKEKMGSVMISDGQKNMRNLIVSMATLKHQVSKLENILDSGVESEWQTEVQKIENLKGTLLKHQSAFEKTDDLIKLERRIAARRRKRKRLKCKKQKRFEEKQEELIQRDIKEAKIDKWRETVSQEMFDIKQKAEMKKMADKTLSTVRSKISETTRKLDLLKGLQRLRKIRMEAAIRIGRYTPDEKEEDFENHISKAFSILTNQREVYEGEEKTLKVLLEAELEENEEIAKQKKQQLQEQKEKIRVRKRNEMLFGKKVEIEASDPLYPYYQYYNQANDNFQSFLQIRQSWDYYVVDNCVGSSRIPDEWVLPSLPSGDLWAKHLQT